MKINKNILICALFVLVMLCVIGSASAEEPLNENLTATDTGGVIDDDVNEKLSISDSEDELSAQGDTITVDCNGDGDYTTISAAVGAATGGETIFIKNGEYTETSKIDISTKQLSFNGESSDGVIIKSGDNDLFYTTGSGGASLVFNNLIFKDISMTSARVPIFIGGNDNVNITNCIFDNCASRYGALRIFTSGSVIVDNCKFLGTKSSTRSYSSAIDFGGSSTTNYILKNSVIDGSEIASSNTDYIFGAIYSEKSDGKVILDNVTISNCNLRNSNGLITAKGNMEIRNSKIINNYVYRDLAVAGLIFVNGGKSVIIESSMIKNNTNPNNILSANSDSASFDLHYNNIQDNSFQRGFGNPDYSIYNLDANYWGSNSLPDGITASTWIVEDNGVYKLNNGEAIDVIIPGLNDGEEPIDAIYVATDGNDANDGSIDSPVFNIAKAIELAKAGSGNIIIKEGTYSQSGIIIDDSITIIGEGNVVIDGTGLERASVFTITTKDVTIKNIKFTNGNAQYGGAIYIQGSSQSDLLDINVIVENCSFDKMTATRGGAIYAYCTKGKLTIDNCNFTNMGVTWGAVCAYQSAYDGGLNVEISKSIFANNSGNNGAALYVQASYLTMTNCEVYNNTASQSPGAIYLTNVTATIDSCKIYDNSALKDASAIAVYAGKISSNPTVLKPSELTITNCIIENNTATQEGAATIYLENSKMDISFSSVVNALNIHNTVTANYDNDKPEKVIANNNWWGVKDPRTTVQGDNITIDNWVIMSLEANVTEVLVGDNVELTVDFNHVNTTSGEIEELTGGAIPKTFTVTFTSNSGSIEPSTVDVGKGTSKKVIYTVADVDAVISAQTGDYIETITFAKGVEPYYGVIYVSKDGDDNNNGSELYPVASLGKAVELALVSGGSGEIIINKGTYAGFNYHVTGNLTVTGVGNVILDGENNGRLFYMDYGDNVDKIQLSNLNVINVKHNYGAVVYSRAKELILDNINITNTTESSNLISNTGKMTIKNSQILNHNGGNVISTSGNYDLVINNTVFKNNTVVGSGSDYGIIYFSSGSGNLFIENSKFIDSTTRQGIIIATNVDEKVYVKSSQFINNHMQGTYASGGAISVNNKLEVTDSIFINNTACGDGGAINIGRWGDATITKSVFINNAAGNGKRGDAIYNGKKLKINYCVLISNGANKVIFHNGEDNDADAQFNWWGTNDDPQNLVGVGTYVDDDWVDQNCVIDTSNWVIMTVSNNYTDQIDVGDKVEFTVDFTHTNSGQALADSIPEVKVNASALYGEMDAQHAKTKNNVAKFVYTAIEGCEDNVTIASSNAVNTAPISVKVPVVLEVIYVSMSGDDNNGGSRDAPVATLKHAIEIAERGKIVIMNGDYTITETLIVDNDLDITGMGTVTINGNQLGILENSANLNLTNIVFTNAKLGTGSVIKDNGNTTINGCTFYSCVTTGSSSAGPVNNLKGTMVINNSKFYQNKGARGVVASQTGTKLIINNSEFYDNDCTSITTSNGIINLNSVDAIIENTVFRNNKVKNGAGIYASRSTSATTGSLEVTNCTFKDNIANIGSGGALFISGPMIVDIKDSTFINNLANASADNVGGSGGAIYTGTSGTPKITVANSIFIDNSGTNPNYGDAGINVGAGTLDISNCVILAKDDDANFALNKGEATVTANDNFWGDNSKANTNANVARWIIMNASYTKDGQGVLTITATFDKTNSTSGEIADYAGSIPDGFDVTFTSTSGNLNEVVPVKNAQASVQYTLDKKDSGITVKVANAEVTFPFEVAPEVIYVSPSGDDNNNGERETPVATLAHAVEIAENGQIVLLEGTYKTGYLGTLSNDLNITAEGKVIIDADNNNRILYVGEDAKVVLKNLIMVNGYGIEGSGALLGNSNYLTIINCTLANSSAGENNGGAIYNVGHLTIINSTIANNTAKEGGAIFANDALAKGVSIVIENSLIENNTATGSDNFGGGAIFTQQIAALSVTNTSFRNNKAESTSSGGAIFISHSTATLSVTDSEFIANHANGQESTGGGAIYMTGTSNYERQGTLTISNTLFEDNTAGTNGGAVYARSTTINIVNSVLLNNKDANGLAVYGYKTEQVSPAITLNDNWWGSNDNPANLVGGNSNYKPTLNRWAILTIANDTPIVQGNTVKLTVSINSWTNGAENGTLANPIKVERPVSIRTTSGIIDGVLENGEFSYDYLVPANLKIISATVDNQSETLFVITSETVLTVENITAFQGETVNVNIIVKTTDGADVNGGTVELYFDNNLVATIPVIGGVASKDVIIANGVGTYDIKANYSDATGEFSYSEDTANLNVNGVNN
ncbi:right-handed parallel beta-helix repeat-containing protein, partial [Methanobrevibacter sp.]|uniref:right-handed parallel beta-helix repeat-containing protein n=1 Tax=Methanobrevibacter sp. TaxID=66852 RepID=UPI002E790D3F